VAKSAVPSYRLHSPSGQAVVTIRTHSGGRRDIYLGEHNSKPSRAEYARVIAGLDQSTATQPSPQEVLSIDEIILAYLRHAQAYYRRDDGSQTTEYDEIKRSLAVLRKPFGPTAAVKFGPLNLEAVRERMIAAQWCRKLINKRIGRIRRMFRWAASRQLLPAETFGALRLLEGLKQGRTGARESNTIKPVGPPLVAATLPYLGRHLRAMVELQRHTGMRPGEVCAIRLSEIDRKTDPWEYRPSQHKTTHQGKERVILIGPRGRVVIEQFITGGAVLDPTAPLFSPRRAREERFTAMREKRRTKVQPSQTNRRKRSPKLQPAEVYTPHTYAHAIRTAVEKTFPLPERLARQTGETFKDWRERLTPEQWAEVRTWRYAHHWHPNQLRHLFATEIRASHGLEAAQVLLGHSSANVTQVYAERDRILGAKVATAVG